MIAIVDYGMGNLRSVHKAFEKAGFPAIITQDPEKMRQADGLVVPGVGAFKKAMENLENLNLIKAIVEFIEKGKPFLGICLGLQLLFSGSEEFGWQRGLAIFPGRVVRFREANLKIPHIGWNAIKIKKRVPIFDGLADGAYFYFVHSYYPVPEEEEIVAATAQYGLEFTSAIASGNLFALQFHPEKSQTGGLQIIKNFGHLVYQ